MSGATQKYHRARRVFRPARVAALRFLVGLTVTICVAENGDPQQLANLAYQQAKVAYTSEPEKAETAWAFGRACFDWAEFSTNDVQRTALAQEGIRACEQALAHDPDSVGAHYYLGMNQGQLARTMSLGALKLVNQMEAQFETALQLDATFNYAGPHRNLGLLYLQAPGWPVSVGNRSKARSHLHKAVELAPLYPENRLNLMEAYEQWKDTESLRRQMKEWESHLAEARKVFSGAVWSGDWSLWDQRLKALLQRLEDAPPDLRSPKAKW